MIGDSTMSVYASNLYPRMGWGQPLGDLFDSKCATVSDKALSGRSSKSFVNEGAWTPIKNALKSGDYDKANIAVRANDEVGQLARTFNVMIDVLRQREREHAGRRAALGYAKDDRAK